jgi:hypothetical protein
MTGDLNLVSNSGSILPTVRPEEALEIAVDSALTVAEKALNTWSYDDEPETKAAAIRTAIARVEALDLQDLGRRLDAAMRPATVKDVAVILARLIAGYPTKNRDPEFSKILFDEVAAVGPSVGGLEGAVRYLLRNSRFLPSISEVIDAVGEAESRFDSKRRNLTGKSEGLGTARALLKYLERTPEEIERDKQEARERDIERCVEVLMGHCEVDDSHLRAGNGTYLRLRSEQFTGERGPGGFFETAIIAEAKQRVLAKTEGWDEFDRSQVLGPTEEELARSRDTNDEAYRAWRYGPLTADEIARSPRRWREIMRPSRQAPRNSGETE